MPPEEDPDPFDASPWIGSGCGEERCVRRRARVRFLTSRPCAGYAPAEAPERRDILPTGMTRLEGIRAVAPPQPVVERLSPRVVCVLQENKNTYTLNGTNCFLVGTGARRVLIDAGESPMWHPKRERSHRAFVQRLLDTLEKEGVTGLDWILVTHLHEDHFGGVDTLRELFPGVAVGMLEVPEWSEELETMTQLRARGLVTALEAGPTPIGDEGDFVEIRDEDLPPWPDGDLSWDALRRSRAQMQQIFAYNQLSEAFWRGFRRRGGVVLCHGQVIRVEGATLRVAHTPGHSENHASFVLEEEHALFSGDHVLGFGTTLVMDLLDYMASLEAMRRYGPVRLYPAHGPHITDAAGLLQRYTAHRQVREDQVVAHLASRRPLSGGTTVTDIAEALYPNTPQARMKQARENVNRILTKLWEEGAAACFEDAEMSRPLAMPPKRYGRVHDPEARWAARDASDADVLRSRSLVDSILAAMVGTLDVAVPGLSDDITAMAKL